MRHAATSEIENRELKSGNRKRRHRDVPPLPFEAGISAP
jgi:hypothetical protein